MQLHWSSRSPFVRKVMVAACELGLDERIELVPTLVAMTRANAELMVRNPLSKLPTLILDDGNALYDSRAICEYLDHLDGHNRLFPTDPTRRFEALRRQALGDGFLDMLLLYRRERNKAPDIQEADVLETFSQKSDAVLTTMETEAASPTASDPDIGDIAIACALSYLDFRFSEDPWRPAYPNLAIWHETLAARPSMKATEHKDA